MTRDQRCEEVAAWHDSAEDGEPMHERLGMTWPQYCEWAGPYRVGPDQQCGVAQSGSATGS